MDSEASMDDWKSCYLRQISYCNNFSPGNGVGRIRRDNYVMIPQIIEVLMMVAGRNKTNDDKQLEVRLMACHNDMRELINLYLTVAMICFLMISC